MLRIALCDDDFNFMQELHQKLIQWYQESDNSRNISVSEFSDSSYLARTIDSGSSFDLLFVDIEMPKMNGMELAKHIRARLPMASRFLTVRRYSDMMRIPYQEIVYVHHVLRTSEIATLNLGIIKDNRGLKEIHGQLGDERFIYIDRSTFVNLDHIRQIKGSEVILRNSEHLPISRQMLTKVKYTINRMWGD